MVSQKIKFYAKKAMPFMKKYLRNKYSRKNDAITAIADRVLGNVGKPERMLKNATIIRHFEKQTKCKLCPNTPKYPEYHHLNCNPNQTTPSNLIKICHDCHIDMHKEISKLVKEYVKKIKDIKPTPTSNPKDIAANIRRVLG